MRIKLFATLTFLATACTAQPSPSDGQGSTSSTTEDETTTTGETSSTDTTTSTGTTESTTSTTSTTTNDDASDDGMSADGDLDDTVPCDMLEQDCPPDQKCMPYLTFSFNTKCVPVFGDAASGEPCTWDGPMQGTDSCDENSGCFDVVEVDDQWTGFCRAFCTGSVDDPQCADGFICPELGNPVTNAFCAQTCDPLAPNCEAGLGCYWNNLDFVCMASLSQVPTGDPCEGATNDCAPGNLCANEFDLPSCDGPFCCTQYCGLQLGDADCAVQPGTTCEPFVDSGEVPPGHENLGVCLSPP